MITPKRFYMIRHGETEHNAARLLAGHTDSKLTQRGREQAKSVHKILPHVHNKPNIILHSNLSRARDTASIINEALNLPMIEDQDIAEHYCGDWEGKPYAECESMLTGWDTPPNGESFDEFCLRIKRSKNNILNSQSSILPLIVCHGGVFRAFGRIYGLNTPGVFKNCHLYEFEPNPEDTKFPWKVWSYSDEHAQVRQENLVYQNSQPLSD